MSDLLNVLNDLRHKFLDLSLRNRFVKFSPGKSSWFQLTSTTPDDLNAALNGEAVKLVIPDNPTPEQIKEWDLIKHGDADDFFDGGDLDYQRYYEKVLNLRTQKECFDEPACNGLDRSILTVPVAQKDFDAQLVNLYRKTQSAIEERGLSISFLVCGFLEIDDPERNKTGKPHLAPLLVRPVTLVRSKARRGGRYDFSLSSEESPQVNEALKIFLQQNYGFVLPDFQVKTEDAGIKNKKQDSACSEIRHYADDLERLLQKSDFRGKVRREMGIALLDFAEFALYKDMDPQLWPDGEIENNPLIQLMLAGRRENGGIDDFSLDDEDFNPDNIRDVDKKYPLVFDADSSQYKAVINALDGKNMVIVGPPGTGKSQTIANIIAALLGKGKTVLFASDKLAALRVVKDKLNKVGLGDFCLELHGAKSDRKQVRESLNERRQIKRERDIRNDATLRSYRARVKELNDYVLSVNEPFRDTEKSVFDIISAATRRGRLIGMYCSNPASLRPEAFSKKDCERLLDEDRVTQVDRVRHAAESLLADMNISQLKEHPWYGLGSDKPACLEVIKTELGNTTQAGRAFGAAVDAFSKFAHAESAKLLYIGVLKQIFASSCSALEKPLWPDYLAAVSFRSEDLEEFLAEFKSLRGMFAQLRKSCTEQFISGTTVDAARGLRDWLDKTLVAFPEDIPLSQAEDLCDELREMPELCDEDLEEQIEALAEKLFDGGGDAKAQAQTLVAAKLLAPLASGIGSYLDYMPHLLNLNADLRKLSESLAALQKEAREIQLDVNQQPDCRALEVNLKQFRDGGFFRWLSGDWRNARRCLVSMGVDVKTEDGVALSEKWLQCLKNLELLEGEFKQLISGIKPEWKGLKTDLESLRRLNAWFDAVETFRTEAGTYGRVRRIVCRRLQTPDAETVRALAEMSEHAVYEPLARLSEQLAASAVLKRVTAKEGDTLRDVINTYVKDVNNVRQCYEEILEPAEIDHSLTISGWKKLLDKLSEYLEAEECFEASPVRAVFGKEKADYSADDVSYGDAVTRLNHITDFKKSIERVKLGQVDGLENSILADLSDHPQEALDFPDALQVLRASFDAYEASESQFKSVSKADKAWFLFSEQGQSLTAQIKKNEEALRYDSVLPRWIELNQMKGRLKGLRIDDFLEKCDAQGIPASSCSDAYRAMAYGFAAEVACDEVPQLKHFIGTNHESIIKEFQGLDRDLKWWQAFSIRSKLLLNEPPQGERGSRVSDLTEMQLVQRECDKQKRFISNRDFLQRAGKAIRTLKPCFMMSPVSIAENLPPGDEQFDVVVMDEASQLRTYAALCAIARGKQIIIVGDPKQLSPTDFFRTINGSDDDEEDTSVIEDSESILDHAMSVLPKCNLNWHYRSRHQSLIAFSNQEFYDNRLILFPSPCAETAEFGIRRHFVPDAVCETGRNDVEAQAVAKAVLEQILSHQKESFGVVAMNETQRSRIELEIDRLQLVTPGAVQAFADNENSAEPYFVKNLENVQGDERDVMFISMTYGPATVGGKVFQRFGPINQDGGERRLNVLFTRAKKRMEVFTSMRSTDILASGSSSAGVRALRDFLEYAETGTLSRDQGTNTGRAPDSDFEIDVADGLRAFGYQCDAQVGVRGYFIDVAVRDPLDPGRYILGVECDGATYHSSKSARDRDYLRHQILTGLGWNIHHIWSTNWFTNSRGELEEVDREIRRLLAKKHGIDLDADISALKAIPKEDSDEAGEENNRADETETAEVPQGADNASVINADVLGTEVKQTLSEALDVLDREIRAKYPDIPEKAQLLSPEMRRYFETQQPVWRTEFLKTCPRKLREQVKSAIASEYLQRVFDTIAKYKEWQ